MIANNRVKNIIVVKNMKNIIILITILTSFKAQSQIIQLQKNDLFPYDSGAAMPLQKYRLIRIKLYKTDSLIATKEQSISALKKSVDKLMIELNLAADKELSYNRSIEMSNGTIERLTNQNNELILKMDELEPKKPFYERKGTYISLGIGLLFGLIIK